MGKLVEKSFHGHTMHRIELRQERPRSSQRSPKILVPIAVRGMDQVMCVPRTKVWRPGDNRLWPPGQREGSLK